MARGEIHIEWSVDYADDPKMIAAGERAELLYIRANCLVKRLMADGKITDGQLARLGLPGVQKRAEKLVEVGLFERIEGGYFIPAFLKRNKSKADILALRLKDSERKRLTVPDGIQTESNGNGDGFLKAETETESETKAVRARKRAMPIPEDWEPSETTKDWIRREYPAHAKRGVIDSFKDYCRSKPKSFVDYDLALRNWVRNEAKWHPAPEQRGPSRTYL